MAVVEQRNDMNAAVRFNCKNRTRVTARQHAPLRASVRKGATARTWNSYERSPPHQRPTTEVWRVVMLQSSGLIRPRASLRCW